MHPLTPDALQVSAPDCLIFRHLKKEMIVKKMKEYKFSDELCTEVLNNWKNVSVDLESEGIEFF